MPSATNRGSTMKETATVGRTDVDHRPRRRGPVTAVAIGTAILMVLGGAAFAAIPDGDGVFHACVDRVGNVRLVEGGAECRSNETAVTWNHTGPQGPSGETGPQGPAGPVNLVTRTSAPVTVPPEGPIVRDALVSCLPGERATGGGGLNSGPAPAFYNTVLLSSFPTVDGAPAAGGQTANGWFVRARHNGESDDNMELTAYVICAS